MIDHLVTYYRHRTSRTIGLVFAAQGVLFGTWAAMIPFVKHKFGLDEAQLGLLLLSLQGGVLIMNPFSVPILHRLGAPAAALLSLALTAVFFSLPMLAPNIILLALALFVSGAGFATVNVAINTCASMLEIRDQIRIMATSHGLWSAGAMAGSALGSTAIGFGIVPAWWSAGLAVLVILLTWWLRPGLLPLESRAKEERKAQGGQKFTWPSTALWLIILLSLCTNITEGTMADWSAVYLRDVVKSEEYAVGWGFSAYAFCMAAGRFFGDGLIANFGAPRMLRVGGAIAAAGLLLLAALPIMPVSLLWFAMVGAGVSLGAPILYAAAAKVPGMAEGAGLATMNTFAMVGFFGGPVLIGFIAKAWSLPLAFSLVGFAALWWAWNAIRIKSN
ncbi:MAG: MFS transporter [Chitinophagales bacterium]|nr:MFS transporter [Chitinophagales bacterium]